MSNEDRETGQEARPANLEVPPKVTLTWLFEHMPIRGVWIGAVLLTTFGLGVLVGNTTSVRDLYGIEPTHRAGPHHSESAKESRRLAGAPGRN